MQPPDEAGSSTGEGWPSVVRLGRREGWVQRLLTEAGREGRQEFSSATVSDAREALDLASSLQPRLGGYTRRLEHPD